MDLRQRPGKRNKDNDFKIGSWNVLSLMRPGSMQNLVDEVVRYNIGVLAMQEIRWKGQGIHDLQNHTLYFSGQQEKHEFGVGFLISKKIT